MIKCNLNYRSYVTKPFHVTRARNFIWVWYMSMTVLSSNIEGQLYRWDYGSNVRKDFLFFEEVLCHANFIVVKISREWVLSYQGVLHHLETSPSELPLAGRFISYHMPFKNCDVSDTNKQTAGGHFQLITANDQKRCAHVDIKTLFHLLNPREGN